MRIALIGATGLVGRKMLEILAERHFPITELIPVASANSIGMQLMYNNKSYSVVSAEDAIAKKPHIALFSAGGTASLELAPKFAAVGAYVIDNSSAWRMHPDIPLVVPEINAHTITSSTKIIANPNCSTIQMVVALAPLHAAKQLKRVIVSTYQSVTGTGKAAVDQLRSELEGREVKAVYPYQIHQNCIPHCDVFLENGYTKEEMKLVLETRKILQLPSLKVSATAVRVPVLGGHSESVYAEFENTIHPDEARIILSKSVGVKVLDNPANLQYPMPILSYNTDAVYVGRIRQDLDDTHALHVFIVADNLRKGAATNAVQIAEYLVTSKLV